jgi:excisionase family DNA binding protein
MYKNNEFHDNIQRINTLLRAKEVVEILNISRSRAYNLMQRGEIPNVRIGKLRRIRSEDLIQYIKKYIPGKPIINED